MIILKKIKVSFKLIGDGDGVFHQVHVFGMVLIVIGTEMMVLFQMKYNHMIKQLHLHIGVGFLPNMQ